MTVQSIQVNDIEVAYRWHGARDGQVVMMAHAMGTSHRIWDAQIASLEDRYRVLRYDWRGHGATSAPQGPYTLAQFVADARATMDALKLGRVHWVGISTGGMIGQGVAIHHPERLLSLTLCNTTSQANPWYREWVAERQSVVKARGMNAVWDMTKHLWFTDAFVAAESEAYRAVRDVFVRTPVAGYLGGTSAVAELAYNEHLSRIRTPTRIIAAGADPVTPVDHSRAILERIHDATLHVLEGQRHFSNVEQPDAFNALLREGLDEMAVLHSESHSKL